MFLKMVRQLVKFSSEALFVEINMQSSKGMRDFGRSRLRPNCRPTRLGWYAASLISLPPIVSLVHKGAG